MAAGQCHGLGEATAQLGAVTPAVAHVESQCPQPHGQLRGDGQLPHAGPGGVLDGHVELTYQVVDGIEGAVDLGYGQDARVIVLCVFGLAQEEASHGTVVVLEDGEGLGVQLGLQLQLILTFKQSCI